MIEFYGASFMGVTALLLETEHDVFLKHEAYGPLGEPPAETREYIGRLAKRAEEACAAFGLAAAAQAASHLYDRVADKQEPCNWQLVKVDLRRYFEFLAPEFGKQRFVFVPPERHKYFEQEDYFHLGSPSRFPEVSKEVREACNCLAVDLPTACVFHLMRVAEWGLRALTRKARVKIKKTPLDWAEWRTLIDGLQKKKIAPITAMHRGPKKDEELEFYRGVIGEFEAFKDVYRNHVMHSRKSYDFTTAEHVMNHVRGFMGRLVTRL